MGLLIPDCSTTFRDRVVPVLFAWSTLRVFCIQQDIFGKVTAKSNKSHTQFPWSMGGIRKELDSLKTKIAGMHHKNIATIWLQYEYILIVFQALFLEAMLVATNVLSQQPTNTSK